MTDERPPKWSDDFPDEAWEVIPDLDWEMPPVQERCRWGSSRYGFCRAATVATLRRGRRHRAYSYCPEHLYGRWIEGGRVVTWRIRRDWLR